MSIEEHKIIEVFGNRLRVRVCGICIQNDKILLIKHLYLGNGYLWSPPGGGMQYGEKIEDALRREFAEETGLQISVGRFLFVHEFLAPPLHAVELFFEVIPQTNPHQLIIGKDPELPYSSQLIDAVKYLSIKDIQAEAPAHLHQILKGCNSLDDLLETKGYYI